MSLSKNQIMQYMDQLFINYSILKKWNVFKELFMHKSILENFKKFFFSLQLDSNLLNFRFSKKTKNKNKQTNKKQSRKIRKCKKIKEICKRSSKIEE